MIGFITVVPSTTGSLNFSGLYAVMNGVRSSLGDRRCFFPNYRFPICIRIGIGIILFTRTRYGAFHDFDDVFETDVPSLATVISMILSLVKSSGRCYDEFTLKRKSYFISVFNCEPAELISRA